MTITEAEMQTKQQKPHSITLQNRTQLCATGINKVIAYDAFSVTADTDMGTLTIGGKNLQVTEINAESGQLLVQGDIEYLQYTGRKEKNEGFFKRLVR